MIVPALLVLLGLPPGAPAQTSFIAWPLRREETQFVFRRPVSAAQAQALERRGLAEPTSAERAAEPGVITNGCHTVAIPTQGSDPDDIRLPEGAEAGVRVMMEWQPRVGYVVVEVLPLNAPDSALRCRLPEPSPR